MRKRSFYIDDNMENNLNNVSDNMQTNYNKSDNIQNRRKKSSKITSQLQKNKANNSSIKNLNEYSDDDMLSYLKEYTVDFFI